MKNWLLFSLIVFQYGSDSDPLLNKEITISRFRKEGEHGIDKIQLIWYYESYITSTKDFVKVVKNDSSEIVMSCNTGLITDINLKKDSIFIQVYGQNVVYDLEKSAFDMPVILDTIVDYNEYLRVYQPEFYKKRPKKK
jgi:hypothetical protein